jgi:hypothetical protein
MASVKTRKHPIYRRTLETEIIRMQTTTLNGAAALKENSHLCRGSLTHTPRSQQNLRKLAEASGILSRG